VVKINFQREQDLIGPSALRNSGVSHLAIFSHPFHFFPFDLSLLSSEKQKMATSIQKVTILTFNDLDSTEQVTCCLL
jgi:hypothetical protein